jgi:hypothetical protein
MIWRFPSIELGVPPCWRAYFLLLRQKKVAKEKATPGYAVGCADFPALLATGGGTPRVLPHDAAHRSGRCGTRPFGPQTVLALFPPAAALLGASHGGRKGVSAQAAGNSLARCSGSSKKPNHPFLTSNPDAFPGPSRGAEQRRRAGGSRFALSEPQASLANHPACRVAQGTRLRRAPTQGWPFLWLLSFGHTKESTPASKAEPQAYYPSKPN